MIGICDICAYGQTANCTNPSGNKGNCFVPYSETTVAEQKIRVSTIEEFYNKLQRNKTDINLANNPWNFVELAYREMIENV